MPDRRTATTWRDLLHPGDARDFFSRRELSPFDPSTSEYNDGNALWLAELSRLVYRHDVEETSSPSTPTRSSFLANVRLRQICFFCEQGTGTQAMLVESDVSPAFAVLVFRGTEQRVKDFIVDLHIGFDTLVQETVAVHKGFKGALDSVWHEVDSALFQLKCPVFYTGHSLGAALATLAAARRKPQAVYTFGSPLVGNEAFVASLGDVSIYRVVDDRDVVTVVPPQVLGFRHVGELKRLTEPTMEFSFNPLVWLRRLFAPPKLLADHAPINYVDRIGE